MHRASEIAELRSWSDPPAIHMQPVKKAVRQAWRRTFGEKCECGAVMLFEARHRHHPRYATIDHILARALGGTDSLDNITVICRTCNGKKSKIEMHQTLQEDYYEQ